MLRWLFIIFLSAATLLTTVAWYRHLTGSRTFEHRLSTRFTLRAATPQGLAVGVIEWLDAEKFLTSPDLQTREAFRGSELRLPGTEARIDWQYALARDESLAMVTLGVVSPMWLPTALIPVMWIAVLLLSSRHRRRRLRRKRGKCIRCGYDLTGNESGVCPECGTEVTM